MSLFLKAVFVFVAFMLLARAAPVLAQGGGGPAGIPLIEYMFARVVCVAVPLGYIALLVVLVIAGIKYLTSGGEPKAVQAAHQTVTWGLLGILFLALAWLILLLIQNFTGVEVTKFNVASLPGVQGFSGQCLGPAPLAPEPPKLTSMPQSTPTTDLFPECRFIPGFEFPIRVCTAKLDCDDIPNFISVIRISNLQSNYITPEGVEQLANVFDNPQLILSTRGSVDGNLYAANGQSSPYAPQSQGSMAEPNLNFTDGYAARFLSSSEIPTVYLQMRVAALRVANQVENSPYNIRNLVEFNGVSCRNFTYYPALVWTPLIYLYPTEPSFISLKINTPLVSTQLPPDKDGYWNSIASHDGTLMTQDSLKHKFISYEFLRSDFKRPDKGVVIEGSKLEEYLRNDLWKKQGLTNSEINDYWQDTKPRVKSSPYYFVSLIDRSEIDRVLPMEVNPKPDTIIRNMTYILPLSQAPSMSIMPLEEEKLKAPERKGFTVLENGVFTDGF